MCIIAVKPQNKPMFDDDIIMEMFNRNPDGAGLMFYNKTKQKVHIEKGFMKVKPLLDYVHENLDVLSETTVVMHFRISTSGKTDGLGCHPYPCWSNNERTSTDVNLAMAHNGMLDSYGYRGTDEVNDTQVFIKDCIRKLPHNFLNNKAIVSLISKSIGTNKLCFLNSDGYHLIGNFIENDGYYFSNESFKPRASFYFTSAFNQNYSYQPTLFDKKEEINADDDLIDVIRKGTYNVSLFPEEYHELSNAIFYMCEEYDPYNADVETYYDDEYIYSLDDENCVVYREHLNGYHRSYIEQQHEAYNY